MTSSSGIFSALLAICSRSPVNSPHKGQWRGAWMFSLTCDWINGWVNNREASDLGRLRALYDVTIMHSTYRTSDSTLGLDQPYPSFVHNSRVHPSGHIGIQDGRYHWACVVIVHHPYLLDITTGSKPVALSHTQQHIFYKRQTPTERFKRV